MTTTTLLPARRALLIGIGRYAHLPTARQLRGPVPDVQALAELLRAAYAFDAVTLLTDEHATRQGILDALAALVSAAQPGDLVLIHYSGHGSRVPDVHGDEPDGWDSSLVPHDGRDQNGLVPDILDDELNPFFGRLVNERRVGDLILVFDSCHSTGMTRADEAPFDPKPRSLEPPAAAPRLLEADPASAPPPPVWQPGGDHFIAFYACQSAETAFELTFDANTVHGALTDALLRALAAGEVKSYRDLWESVVLRMAQTSPQQHPQVEGQLDRGIFGRESVQQMFYVPVLGMTSQGLVRLGGGRALGLDVGDRLRVAPPGTRRLSQVGVGALIEIAPLGLALHECLATVISGGGAQAGQWALLEATRADNQLPVAVTPAAAYAGLIAKLQRQPLLRVVDAGAAVTVEISANEARFLDDNGQALLRPLKPSGFVWQAEVVDGLAGLAWRRNFLRLSNPDSRLTGALRVEVLGPDASALTPSSPQQWEVDSGAQVRFSVTNGWSRELYLAVVTVREGAEPVQVWPPGSGASLPVAPGRAVTVDLPAIVAPLVVKVFAATRQIPFELLTRGRTRRASSDITSALSQMLLQAQGEPAPPSPAIAAPAQVNPTRTVTQPRSSRDDDDWITVQALVTRRT
ncbi:caspase family protein [Candidatus Amarolinea aalborgensis]|jgi:hypothetical protein|uniref:caspase family protein n=1 Tax=Candidatus Amarolinea aalborgensis TaxID=2249329 RepID=UPI003BF98E26